MAITGPEPVIDAIVARLNNELQPFITTINAEATDGVVVAAPVNIFGFPPPRSMITETPVLSVVEGPFVLEDDTGFGATGSLEVSVVSYYTDYDPASLAAKLRRLDRAVIQCILAERTIPNIVWGITFVRSDPGPTLSRRETPREMFSIRASTFHMRFEQDT